MSWECTWSEVLLKIICLILRCFGARNSLRKWDKQRKVQSFESHDSAIKRTESNKGEKMKDHIGNITSYTYNNNTLAEELNKLNENDCLKISELARKIELKNSQGNTPNNGGQIMKYILENHENIDI